MKARLIRLPMREVVAILVTAAVIAILLLTSQAVWATPVQAPLAQTIPTATVVPPPFPHYFPFYPWWLYYPYMKPRAAYFPCLPCPPAQYPQPYIYYPRYRPYSWYCMWGSYNWYPRWHW
jgi:hypothetical protein